MGGYRTTNLTENRNDSHDITTQFFANYAKTLGRHDFSVMIGYEDYYAFLGKPGCIQMTSTS